MKKVLISLLSVTLMSCSMPILNNANQYSDLDKEYSQFKTKALTQSYLKKKMDKWLSDDKYSKNLGQFLSSCVKTFKRIVLRNLLS